MASSPPAGTAPRNANEFALAVECCRWTFAGGDPGPVQGLAALVEWTRFESVVKRHRVEGLAWHCLRSLAVPLPVGTRQALAADAAAVAEHNLRAARQSAMLLQSFDQARIPLLFVKGLTLSKLAYGDPFLKMSRDIDVLVPGEAVAAAAAALGRLGYALTLPAAAPQSAAFERWHRKRKESVWRSPNGLHVELHSRLADSRELIPGIGVGSPRQEVEVAPGIVLPTLARDELFAYLCVHGASSAWFRLKWVTDLAALLHGGSAAEIARLYDRSQQLGAGRAAAQALLLAARTYGTAVGDLERKLGADPVNRWLADAAWKQMMRPAEPTQAPLGTATIHWTQLFLLPGARFKLGELSRQLSDLVA
jgi:hypothetical protein